MTVIKKLKELTACSDDLQTLLNLDAVYLIHSAIPDDNNFISLHDIKYIDFGAKLRGDQTGPSQMAHKSNDTNWFRGWITGAVGSNVEKFEKEYMFDTLGKQGGFTYEKIDIKNYRDQVTAEFERKKQVMFDSLFEVQ